MGQILDIMGQEQSKNELLYEFVINGDVEAVKSLCRQGAGLEWKNRDGKTPLIAACMDDSLYTVAQTLIEFGADVNAYCEGPHAGTPLHHAAARGLDTTVKLLLSHGANTSVTNDNYHTPLHVARLNGYANVVRTLESHMSYFSGWLRKIYGPGFPEAWAPQWLSSKIWGVVKPCGSNNLATLPKLQLLIYNFSQDSWPCQVISLWKAQIERPNFHQSDPTLIIFYKSTRNVYDKKEIVTHYKLASAIEGDKQQIQSLYNACRGIHQGSPPPVFHDAETAAATQTDAATSDAATPPLFHDAETSDAATPPLFHDAETSDAATPPLFHVAETSDAEAAAATQTDAEAIELAMAISASIQSTAEHRPPPLPIMHHFSAWGDFFDIDSPPPLIRAAASDAETAVATQTDAEAIELAMAISASIQSNAKDRPPPLPNMHHFSDVLEGIFGSTGWGSSSRPAHLDASSSGWTWDVPGSGASSNPTQNPQTQGSNYGKKEIVTHYMLASAIEGDKQQIQSLYGACRGIPQMRNAFTSPPPLFHDAETSDAATPPLYYDSETSDAETAAATQTDAETSDSETSDAEAAAATQTDAETSDSETSDAEAAAATQTDAETSDSETSDAEAAAATQTDAEAIELATAISASIQSTAEDRPPPLPNMHQFSNAWGDFFGSADWGSSSRPAHLEASSSGWTWDVPGSGASSNPTQHPQTQGRIPSIFQSSNRIPASCSSIPSAPPIPVEDDLDESLIYYPPIHSNPGDLSIPAVEDGVSKASDKDNGGSSSLCVICWEAPAECACVPCGHVAGCMDCLKEIKANKGACPICRSKIDQVLKIYAV